MKEDKWNQKQDLDGRERGLKVKTEAHINDMQDHALNQAEVINISNTYSAREWIKEQNINHPHVSLAGTEYTRSQLSGKDPTSAV